MALPGSYIDCKSYADKLRHWLQWAYQAAQKCIDKETTRYKKYYDKNYKCAVLKEGDLVLVRINVRGTDHEITDKWKQVPCEVIGIKTDSPTIIIKNTLTGEVRELHRNMLYPLRMVDRDDESENATPVLAKANVVMDTYSAFDCRNCRDTV